MNIGRACRKLVARLQRPTKSQRLADAERGQAIARANNMNTEEGHLGGYIRASTSPAPSGLNIEHGDPATWNPSLWRWAYDALGVRSVLDVGCGEGHSAAFFERLGCDVCGIDGSRQAKRDTVITGEHIVHDHRNGPYTPVRRFDLVWSCEFVEHVEEQYLPNFLATFEAARRYVMITYAEPGQGGWHHVNCQTANYWISVMDRIDFRFDEELTQLSRGVAEPGHYRDKGLVFERRPDLESSNRA
jgi:SAM-dependent methyltransferase